MTLGEKIAALRVQHNLSQGDLAEKINVSRQSVSKWETGASIPDLDKLICLSTLFDVTLDELVKGDTPEAPPAPPQQTEVLVQTPTPYPTRKIVGWILLGVGLFSMVLGVASNLLLLFLGGYLTLCGLVCLLVTWHPGLVIGWGTFLLCAYFLPRGTSANMSMVFLPYVYEAGLYIQLTVSYAFWVMLFLLIILTVKNTRLNRHTLLFCGWAVLSQSYGFIPAVFHPGQAAPSYLIVAWCVLMFGVALVFFTGRAIVQWAKRRWE